jgi:hypothetical protein
MNSKVHVILTDDYEIFGHGSGDIDCCLINPTEKLLKVCKGHGVPITLFADVAEYWAFEEEEKKGTLPKEYIPATKMRNQLTKAIQARHDVQLHLHPQWLNYSYDPQKGWQIDEDLWHLASLPYGDYNNRKSILGSLYQAKAGSWCIQPELQVLKSLKQIGIRIESTVAPGCSYNDGLTIYDFREFLALSKKHAYWQIVESFHRTSSEGASLMEVPILTVPFLFHRRLINRIRRKHLGLHNKPPLCPGSDFFIEEPKKKVNFFTMIKKKIKRQIMIDFNVVTADEMYFAVKKTEKLYGGKFEKIPIVFISHSKSVGEENLKELEKFIVKAKKRGVLFGKYEDILAWENENRGT